MTDTTKIILGAVSILIGLILLPITANFAGLAKSNDTQKNISGLNSITDIIVYTFTFALVGLGIGMIVSGLKK